MRIRLAVPEEHASPDVVDAALEAVTRTDEQLLASGKVPPFSPDTGVRWRPEPMGDEHFDNASIVLGRGWGDCDDLAPWRAASLRHSGEDPGAFARVIPSGPSTYHAVVQRSDGSLDDPSVAAGMKVSGPHTVGGGDAIHVHALDPHDGRVYEGALLPTVGPLTHVAGPAYAIRHLGACGMWQARCDAPLIGSRLVRVHSYYRHRPHHHRRRIHAHGWVPYSLASIHTHPDPHVALHGAVLGAMCYACPEDAARMQAFLASARR
jgi:hypothetical protein